MNAPRVGSWSGTLRRDRQAVALDHALQDAAVPIFLVTLQLERLAHERIGFGLCEAFEHRAGADLDLERHRPDRNRAQARERNLVELAATASPAARRRDAIP